MPHAVVWADAGAGWVPGHPSGPHRSLRHDQDGGPVCISTGLTLLPTQRDRRQSHCCSNQERLNCNSCHRDVGAADQKAGGYGIGRRTVSLGMWWRGEAMLIGEAGEGDATKNKKVTYRLIAPYFVHPPPTCNTHEPVVKCYAIHISLVSPVLAHHVNSTSVYPQNRC